MARTASLLNKVWARLGVRVNPDTDNSAGADLLTIEGGHIDSQGPFSTHMNYEQHRVSALLNEVEKDGILEWSDLTTYGLGSFCKVGSLVYQSLSASNVNNVPASSPSKWKNVPLGSLPTNYVTVYDSITSLQAAEGLVDGQTVFVSASGYSGLFVVDGVDGATADDGFDVIVTADDKRVKRREPEKPITISGNTTLTIAHHRRTLRVIAESVLTISSAVPVGWRCEVKRATPDQVAFAADGSDVLQSSVAGGNSISDEYGWAGLYKDADGIVSLIGQIDVVSL